MYPKLPLSKTRIRVAWGLALAVDAIQIPANLAGPAGWFLGAGLDLITMVVMWAMLGFHWAFLPSFITEAVPYLNLAPLWTLAVALATRGRRGGRASPTQGDPGMNANLKGLGGVFLYAEDPAALAAWYARHFGLAILEWEPGACFGLEFPFTEPDGMAASLIFSIQKAKTPLGPGRPDCMLNWRVGDLDALCADLEAGGISIERREDSEYGRFAWIQDPEGHRLELYQPQ